MKLLKLSQILLRFFLKKYSDLKTLEENVNQNHSLSQENRKLRKILDIYKQALSYGSQSISNDLFQCPNCPKAFGDVSFLHNHITRRHPESGLDAKGLLPLSRRIGQYSSALQTVTNSANSLEEVKKAMENIRAQLNATQEELQQEREARQNLESKLTSQLHQRPKQVSTQVKIESYSSQPSSDERFNPKTPFKNREAKEDDDKCKNSDLTDLLLSHTMEVRNMGFRLEKLIEKLDVSRTVEEKLSTEISGRPFQNQIQFQNESSHSDRGEPRLALQAPRATAVKDRRSLLNKLSQKLKTIGVKENDRISYTAFHEALREVKTRRIQFRTYDRANHLRQFLDHQLRSSDLTDFVHSPAAVNNQEPATYRPKLERTVSEPTDFNSCLTKDKKFDSWMKSTSSSDSNISDSRPKLKSLLIQRDSQGKRLSTDDGVRSKKLRFNDKRIEISPEPSDSQDEADFDLEDEVIGHEDRVEVDEEQLLEENIESVVQSETGQPKETSKAEASDSLSKTYLGYERSLSDSLKATDLQWFDSDSDSEVQPTGSSSKKVDQVDPALQEGNSLTTNELFNDKTVSVHELTRIIEEQLQTRTTAKGPSNSVDAVTGRRQQLTDKPVGTLTIESDSE